MALQDLANVVISTEGPALTQVGFGTLLIACYHALWVERTRTYTSLSSMVTDGFAATDPGYIAARIAFSQDPRPPSIKIGRCALPFTQVVRFTPTAANTAVYSFTMKRGATSVDISYTSDSSATVAEIVAGLAAAVEASTLSAAVVAVAGGSNTYTSITDGTAGVITYYSNWTNNLAFIDVTPDPGIATDLDAIRLADGDWYGLGIDLNSNAIAQAAAGWAETQDMLAAFNTSDSVAYDSGVTTDLGYALKNLSTGRSMVGFDKDTTQGYMGVAMLAERFPHDPGQAGAGGTFHGKTLAAVTADTLTATQKTNLRAKNYVVYITTAGRAHTLDGKVAGGEFADKVRFLDWFRIRTEESIATAILDNDKIPYTDRGITIILSKVLAMLQTGEAVEGFTPGSTSATAPRAADVSSADKSARKLTGIRAAATLAGAIHLVDPVSVTVAN